MKKLLLLSALLIFACSSDDEVTETFLERYNGIVWDIEADGGGAEYILIAFTNQPKGFIGLGGYDINDMTDECHEVVFGVPYETSIYDGSTVTTNNLVTIIENSENRLEYLFTDDAEGEFDRAFEYSALYEVSEDGNDINVTYTFDATNPSRTFNGTRTELLVTSCN